MHRYSYCSAYAIMRSMNSVSQRGFTIIETTLVLAIAGLLAVGILVGSGLAINQQRYRDSVNRLRSTIQNQYAETAAIFNSRDGRQRCADQGAERLTIVTTGDQERRGTSDCVIIGRYLTINGQNIVARNVVAKEKSGSLVTDSNAEEVNMLRTAYRMEPIDGDKLESDIEWGMTTRPRNGSQDGALSILIIRSPISGSILTFATTSRAPIGSANMKSLIGNQFMARRELCVDPNGTPMFGAQLGVRLEANASGGSAVSTPLESEGVCS